MLALVLVPASFAAPGAAQVPVPGVHFPPAGSAGGKVITFTHALGQMGIPVALTVQIDTIAKPGRRGAIIPANVASAINFYQTRGPDAFSYGSTHSTPTILHT
jgi:hypothetical protein